MFWTIAWWVCVWILLAYAIIKHPVAWEVIKNPQHLWSFIKLVLFSILLLSIVILARVVIIYTVYYGFKYWFHDWHSIPILLKIWWWMLIVAAITSKIVWANENKVIRMIVWSSKNQETSTVCMENKTSANEKNGEVKKNGEKKKVIKKKTNKLTKKE